MPIVPSRSRQIQELIASLAASSAAERDRAAARLRLLGARAVLPLVRALQAADPATRLGALRCLEHSQDPRALAAIAAAAADPDASVALAALAGLVPGAGADAVAALFRALSHADAAVRRAAARGLAAAFAAGSPEATSAVLTLLEDATADEALRLVALEAVAQLPARDRRTVLSRLGRLSGELGRRVAALRGEAPPEAQLLETLSRQLEAAPEGAAGVASLHAALRRLAADAPADAAWPLRLRLHAGLADRASRIALYDLREMLEARPLRDAPALLGLAARSADASFVPTLARLAHDAPAHSAACVEALAAIIRRESLKKTHRTVRAVRAEHRPVLDGLWAKATKTR